MKDKIHALIGIAFSFSMVVAAIIFFRNMMESKGIIFAWAITTGALLLCVYLISIYLTRKK